MLIRSSAIIFLVISMFKMTEHIQLHIASIGSFLLIVLYPVIGYKMHYSKKRFGRIWNLLTAKVNSFNNNFTIPPFRNDSAEYTMDNVDIFFPKLGTDNFTTDSHDYVTQLEGPTYVSYVCEHVFATRRTGFNLLFFDLVYHIGIIYPTLVYNLQTWRNANERTSWCLWRLYGKSRNVLSLVISYLILNK